MTRDAALALTALGFAVFPIAAGAKFPPLWKDWPNRSVTTIPADWPEGANIGVSGRGWLILDCDSRKGGDETLLSLDLEDGLPDTLTAQTPNGRHLFYRAPTGYKAPNTVEKLGTGLDTRGWNGYVVGVGSRIANGEYAWLNPDAPIADAPQWLIDRLGTVRDTPSQAGTRVPDADAATVERAAAWLAARPGAVEGQGGDAFTFATAAFLRDYGLADWQALSLMSEEWNERCSPPWNTDDLATKVINAYRYAEGEPGEKAVTADDFPTVVQDSAPYTTGVQAPRVNRPGLLAMADIPQEVSAGRRYVVKGLLLQKSYATLYGPPGEGKTFVALDLAYHVAAGEPWMGRRVRQGPVLYIGFEAYGGLSNRARALRQKYGKDAPLYFAPGGFNIRDLVGRQALAQYIGGLPEKPRLIVMDTFAYALAGGDENSAQDVGAFNSVIQALIESTGACVLLIHHTGKDAAKGARGSSALPAAVDTEIALDGPAFTPTKQRELELGAAIGVKLTPVAIGVDEDGDPVTSCVVDGMEIVPQSQKSKRATRTDDVWVVLCERSPNNEPITLMALEEYCEPYLSRRSGRAEFGRAISELKAVGLIEERADRTIVRVMA